MRILVDECVDWRLLRDLTDYDAKTVKQLGWEHMGDGDLLTLAAEDFEVFVRSIRTYRTSRISPDSIFL
jgi:predicted nuclease of predicted toxin-antitoxin system